LLEILSGIITTQQIMRAYYSILSVYTKPEIDERLSIGMIMHSSEKIFFHYSKQKLAVIQRLLSKEAYKAAINYLKTVGRTIAAGGNPDNSGELDLSIETRYDRILNENYLEYLSRYNNNLVTFSKPQIIDYKINQTNFESIFRILVDEFAFDVEEKPIKTIERFKEQYFPRLRSFFNIGYKIGPPQYERLLTPVKVDLMGRNEREVFGQSIDFEKIQLVEFSIGSLLQLSKAVPNAKQFIIGYEPRRELKENHQIWNHIRQYPDFEYVDISEAEKIVEYAQVHEVTPLFPDKN